LRVRLADVINCAKFIRYPLRGLDSVMGQILTIPIQIKYLISGNTAHRKTRKKTETERKTETHSESQAVKRTHKIKQTTSTNYKLSTSTSLLLLLLLKA